MIISVGFDKNDEENPDRKFIYGVHVLHSDIESIVEKSSVLVGWIDDTSYRDKAKEFTGFTEIIDAVVMTMYDETAAARLADAVGKAFSVEFLLDLAVKKRKIAALVLNKDQFEKLRDPTRFTTFTSQRGHDQITVAAYKDDSERMNTMRKMAMRANSVHCDPAITGQIFEQN